MRNVAVGLALAVVAALAPVCAQGAEGYRLLRLGGQHVKWGAPVQGVGATVSYAFVEQPMRFPGAFNCGEMVPLDGLLVRSDIARPQLAREVAAAFAMWNDAADIDFRHSDDPASAQILIGAQERPRGRAFANLAYGPPTDGGTSRIEQALICLNPTQPWKIGFDGDLEAYDLRYALAHEVGHAIGLDHPPEPGTLMFFRYDEELRTLRPGDVRGAVALYGERGGPGQGWPREPVMAGEPDGKRHRGRSLSARACVPHRAPFGPPAAAAATATCWAG